MTYSIYKYLTIVLSPFINIYIWFRLLLGKEECRRIGERFGNTKVARPSGNIIWVQCASVGESITAMPLIDNLIKEYNGKITILLTTTTKTSAKMLEKRLKDKTNIIHQYTPIDKYYVILKFLDYWQPIALINIESEIWPNAIALSHKYCKKIIIATAKMSTKSFRRWKFFKKMREFIFKTIDICYPQSDDDDLKLHKLGMQNTIMFGNLKFDCSTPKINKEYLKKLQNEIGDKKIILLASVHLKEIKNVYKLYLKTHNKVDNVLFIFAIRHPDKSNDFYKKLTKKKLKVARKSKNEKIEKNTDIYMYDEMGEMGTFYVLSDVVVMCGSFVKKIGGHNPIEVAKCEGGAILTAPFIKGNKVLFQELEKQTGCIICKNKRRIVSDMRDNITFLFHKPKKIKEMSKNAYNVTKKFSNVANDMAKSIKREIES